MALPAYVLDASVLVARVRRAEAHHEAARQVLRALVGQASPLYVPAIAIAEVASAIGRGTGNGERATRAVADLLDMPGLQVLTLDEQLGKVAAMIAARHRLRGCDAVYVALSSVLETPLITLDRQQRERAPSGIIVQTPAEALAHLTGQ